MDTVKRILMCRDVETIREINDQFDYEDEYPQGGGDSQKVACGQKGTYNELQYILENKLREFIDSGAITETQAINALCSACHDLPNPRERNEFYDRLKSILGITFE